MEHRVFVKHPTSRRRLLRRTGVVLASSALVATGAPGPATADTAPPAGTPATVSVDALPTWQINGVVWSQVTVGNTVYATGSFTRARPPGAPAGSNEVVRNNLLAYDITTGNLITSFNHSLNAQGLVAAASPDGSRVYVGGDFTTVDGLPRNHIAAFDTATGALSTAFAPSIGSQVRGIAATNGTVYAGGNFFSVNGMGRTRLAAMSASNGALLPWPARADDHIVRTMVLSPDNSRVIVGGHFTRLNGVPAYGMGSLDAATGATLPWAANQTIRDAGNNGAITSLRADGTQIYGTGYAFGAGSSFEGTFAANPSTGAINWLADCHGDFYDSLPVGQVLYSVSHAHDCRWIGDFPETNPRTWHHTLAQTTYATGVNRGPDNYGWNYNGIPAARLLHWFPDLAIGSYTRQYQAGWSLTGNSNYIAVGGEFPRVNGVPQQGLTRFAVRALAPNRVGPVASAGLTPSASVAGVGAVNVAWRATWDMDNANLTYSLLRDGGTSPVYTTTVASNFWTLPTIRYTDTGLAGGTHTYRVRVTDPLGNTITGGTSSPVTVVGGPNTAPTASFTTSCTGLTCSVDGTGSTDPDGGITGYAWNFGDGATASGATASHTYAAAGTYQVTLTVTDNQGATNSTSRTVSVAPQPGPVVHASDAFNRTLSGTWGSADVGGPWTSYGNAAYLSVTPGAGRLSLPAPAVSSGAYLGSVSTADATTTATIAADKAATGGGTYLHVVGRRVSATGEYRGRVRLLSGGPVAISLTKLDGTATETFVRMETTLAGVAYTPGMQLRVRVQVTGTNPTTLNLKVWPAASAEPAGWQLTATDTSAALQATGNVGVRAYLSGSATNAPVVASFSNFSSTAG